MVKEGTLWWGGRDKKFRVISVTEVDGHVWVYYREEAGLFSKQTECREYSCYIESFVQRFTQIPE
jgi:hypothetical protein